MKPLSKSPKIKDTAPSHNETLTERNNTETDTIVLLQLEYFISQGKS